MLEQQQQSAEAERRYSPEEAGEILRLAANLQENSFSLEQLRAIASEAGISEENLQHAVQEYEQQRKAALSRQASRTLNRRRSLGLFALGFALLIILVMAITLFALRSSEMLSANASSTTVRYTLTAEETTHDHTNHAAGGRTELHLLQFARRREARLGQD